MPPPSPCEIKWRAAWYGPNASTGGVWNSTVKRIAAMAPHQSNRGRLLGYYVGDELLAQGLSVSSLTAVFDLLKETWPNATTYYNEEWSVINDPSWRDKDGKPYVTVPDSLGKCTRSLCVFF